jgi:hypothetical protein
MVITYELSLGLAEYRQVRRPWVHLTLKINDQ